jgi:hypothetical protein
MFDIQDTKGNRKHGLCRIPRGNRVMYFYFINLFAQKEPYVLIRQPESHYSTTYIPVNYKMQKLWLVI